MVTITSYNHGAPQGEISAEDVAGVSWVKESRTLKITAKDGSIFETTAPENVQYRFLLSKNLMKFYTIIVKANI